MSVTEALRSTDNGLDGLAAAGSGLLALFLFLGGYGHLVAVWPDVAGELGLVSLLPGLLLLAAAVVNLLACVGLGRGRVSWRWAALLVNALLAIDLVRLMIVGVPNHPIGVFLALVCSQLIVLGALLAGLQWRAPSA